MNEFHTTLIGAWRLWLSGARLDDHLLLFNISMLSWARIGKCLELVAALTILADIMGVERLRGFGYAINTTKLFTVCCRVLRSRSWAILSLILLSLIVLATPGLYLGFGAMMAGDYEMEWLRSVATFQGLCAGIIVLGFGITVIGMLFDILLIRPASYLLAHTQNDRIIKATSVVVLLIGFHFDLLTS